MSKGWTKLGLRARRTFRCEDMTGMGTQCRRLAKWRYGERGAQDAPEPAAKEQRADERETERHRARSASRRMI